MYLNRHESRINNLNRHHLKADTLAVGRLGTEPSPFNSSLP